MAEDNLTNKVLADLENCNVGSAISVLAEIEREQIQATRKQNVQCTKVNLKPNDPNMYLHSPPYKTITSPIGITIECFDGLSDLDHAYHHFQFFCNGVCNIYTYYYS